jgi:DNA invertase Pin-like site-specific DNA recombinase
MDNINNDFINDDSPSREPSKSLYVAYYRVSTQRQGESGLGLDAQKRDINLYLENYCKGCEVVREFTEIASGADSERPLLKEAIELAKQLGATLLVAKLDRLSRKVVHVAKLMDDKELKLRVAQMPNADKFQLHIYAALAEQEREFISKRTKAAMREARERAKLEGRPHNQGGLRGSTAKANQARRAKALKEGKKLMLIIKPLRDSGKSLREVATALNSAGMTTATGKRFTATHVSRILSRVAKEEAMEDT